MTAQNDSRTALRRTAIGLSAAVALLYAVVGLEIVKVHGVAEVEPGPAVPLVIASIAFAVLTITLAIDPGRRVYVAGLLLDALVLIGYFAVAPSRHPSFEAWGLSIKAIEVALLGALASLAIRRSRPADEAAASRLEDRQVALR